MFGNQYSIFRGESCLVFCVPTGFELLRRVCLPGVSRTALRSTIGPVADSLADIRPLLLVCCVGTSFTAMTLRGTFTDNAPDALSGGAFSVLPLRLNGSASA